MDGEYADETGKGMEMVGTAKAGQRQAKPRLGAEKRRGDGHSKGNAETS